MPILETQKLTKHFQGVKALTDVDFELRRGEIHAIMGENGAGKSTFVKLIAGVYKPTSGTYSVEGHNGMFASPKEALPHIGLVHQDRELIPHFDGFQNLFLGSEIAKQGFLAKKEMKRQCMELMEKYNLHIDLTLPARELGAGQQELLTILKILFRQPPILIFDEPTAPLSMQESEILFRLIRELKEKGFSMIYISHRLPEVLELSDRISVFKNGLKVVTLENKGITEPELISYMISKNLENQYPKVEKEIKPDTAFEVRDFSYAPHHLQDISFSVKKGEIVGFAGLVGAGRTELAMTLFGGKGEQKGKVFLDGTEFTSKNPKQSIEKGLVLIPEDRRGSGVIMRMSIKDNVILPSMKELSNGLGFRREKKIREHTRGIIDSMAVVTSSQDQPVNTLSGGNQQKVAIGKWLSSGAKVWIFDEPTQGIDVETKSSIYKMLGEFARDGAGVIFISSDLRELTEICDRIYVMKDRRMVGEFTKPFNAQDVLSRMIGVSDE